MSVKGFRERLQEKKEMRFTQYQYTPATANFIPAYVSANPLIIWSNDGLDLNAKPFFNQPTQGTSRNQFLGDKFNMLYADVAFVINQRNAGTILPSTINDQVRVLVIRRKDDVTPFTTANIFRDVNSFLSDVETKMWEVQYDKFFAWSTGFTTTSGGTTVTSIQSKSKLFRMTIPLQQTMTLSTDQTPFSEDQQVYIIAYACLNANLFEANAVHATYYFKDDD